MLYAQDGVNISVGDEFSKHAAIICKTTWGSSLFVTIHDYTRGNFRGPRGFTFHDLPEGYFHTGGADGIGTKVVIITEAMSHYTAARDLVAMTCGDITRYGGLPLIFINVLDVATFGNRGSQTQLSLSQVMNGLYSVAVQQRLVLFAGETAELGICVGSENPDAVTKFNWAGFALGVNHPNQIITGERVKTGDIVVALREQGFRSNGMSAVRAAFRMQFGEQWWKNPDAKNAIQAAAQPSILYDLFLATANGWYGDTPVNVSLIAHITGGGIVDKLFRDCLAPMGLGAHLDDLWYPPKIMQQCAQWREMPDAECYEVWNGGQGVVVVLQPDHLKRFLALAKPFGIQAKVCGTITANPTLIIQSKFLDRNILEYGA
ncbi:MAG: Phosphoribosylformylglycinamidine cyclo-ligase [Parcubacteria group bacterium GW2011_GWA2_43_13]|nr:MAG: Phosphoribosylformylglycinamidine cyclo-ligase [Parcubacteria group bacterium GW2011_GWA2_43_13]OGY69308.1 MAG: hypothetical protein A3B94_01105 [Candidatus Jacksonbacteria bacterium RIFCSPHIGHO2_02_FULL_43_10]OGY70608.1 MAG: hypothetical protein A2986_02795 [Candidatus Jacksonbacteria bacterium RIFCSPLOWO2_01_FULL_44_13]HAZ16273.1 hypothetical protein [Candidatus Jacksonbacteria bacterium]